MRALIKFTHGLGDSVQLTIVLAHLKKYLPNWIVDVWALHGKHSAMRGNCSMVFSDRGEQPRESEYDQIISLSWSECHRSFSNVPSTKAALCVADVFRIDPDPSLFYYTVKPTPQAELAADEYLHGITNADAINGRWNVALIHYQGNTSADRKNLSHDVIAEVCRSLRSRDITPVILDWDRRTPLADDVEVFCPGADNPLWGGTGTGDAGTIAAMISRSRLFVGVDSGPCHVAGATDTPTIAVWTGHTPVRYFDRADNVVHLVPPDWRDSMSAEQIGVFERLYRHKARESNSLARDIVDLASSLLSEELARPHDGSLVRSRGFLIRRDNISQDLTIVNDVFHADCYKLNIIPGVVENAKYVVDIGAHIGSFAKLVHSRNPKAKIICVEVCPENLEALRANVGSFAEVVHAACTYENGELALCNAVRPNCVSTGGSVVTSAEKVAAEAHGEYWPDRRPIAKVTLEHLCQQYGFAQIDLLKLDCEGSEYSILEGCDLSKVKFIVGEYHGQSKWDKFRSERLAGLDYGHMSKGNDMGNFHLKNQQ